MKRIAIILMFLLSPVLHAQTFTVSGHVVNPTNTAASNSKVVFTLVGTGNQQCKVSGTGVIIQGKQPFTPDGSGAISGTLYRNDFIVCGVDSNTQWQYQIFNGGAPQPSCTLAQVTSSSLNLDNTACSNTTPVVTPPTGDNTYCRLDGSNCGFTGNVTLNNHNLSGVGALTAGAASVSSLTSTGAVSGTAFTQKSINGFARIMVDQYASWSAALADCPAAGCVLDGTSPNTPTALGTFDPGSKQVVIKLGPLSFTANHLILEANEQILCNAAVNVSGAGTIITSVGANAQPLLVLPASGTLNVRGVVIDGCTFQGAAGNTSQDGLFADVSTAPNGSVFDHPRLINIHFSGFKGNSIHYRGSLTGGGNFVQFVQMYGVSAVRPTGGGEALRIEGSTGQLSCIACQFDGPAIGDGNNIYIGMTANTDTSAPYSISFYDLTCQAAETCLTGNGFNTLALYDSHHESLHGAYLLESTFTNARDGQAIFSGGHFQAVGSNAGNGYILNASTGFVFGAVLEHSNFNNVSDHTIIGSNGAEISTLDNVVAQNTTIPIITSGIDFTVNPAATLNLGSYHTVALQASGTSITTIKSSLGPGEPHYLHRQWEFAVCNGRQYHSAWVNLPAGAGGRRYSHLH